MDKVEDHDAAPTRLIVADDHHLFRSALRHLLDGNPDLQVVGEAADGREALELCRRLRPELVLMDVQMPRMDGLAATRAIKREVPNTIVLVVTTFEDPDYLFEAIKGGAGGYVLKTATPQEVIAAVREVLAGGSPFSREVSAPLLRRLVAEGHRGSSEDVSAPGRVEVERRAASLARPLIPRELEVLRLVMLGQTNKEIACNLFVSTSTVKKYVRGVIDKLGVSDRTQAAVRAVELGVLPREEGRG